MQSAPAHREPICQNQARAVFVNEVRKTLTASSSENSANSRKKGKAARSKIAILESAEQHFAKFGYTATRLEDIADDAGLTRPALFYHFPDKQALYHATLANAFSSLVVHIENALSGPGSIAQRFELAMEVLIEEIVIRPTLGRLILRYVTDIGERPEHSIYPESDSFIQTAWALFQQGCENGELKPLHEHPFHAASAVIGSTVFYTSAITTLIPSEAFDPLSPEHVAAQKSETLQVGRILLGINSK